MKCTPLTHLLLTVTLMLGGILQSQAANLDNLGSFDFPTSGSPEAQQHFLEGVGYLHSFGWEQARQAFRRAQEVEPDFAMAYWGEAFSYNHPFIGEWDAESPAEVLERLGDSSAERLAKAPTEREKGFLRAAEAYAFTSGPVGNKRTAWMEAMADLYESFPDDREVKAFYAVAMLSGATAMNDERAERLRMRAGAMALELFRANPDHPGAAHYTIHAFDDPVHAPIALEAARKYAQIAPAVSHALHMPTHIFIQHGMWPEVVEWNRESFQAGRQAWQPGDRPNDMNHSSDWGQYGALQMMDLEGSQDWMRKAEQVLEDNPDDQRSQQTIRTMRARHTIETQQWQIRELTDELNADQLLALGLSAANMNRLELARSVAERLNERVEANPDDLPLRVAHAEVEAMTLLRDGTRQRQSGNRGSGGALQEQALERLNGAVQRTEEQSLPRGAANPLKPVHELTGEVLLTMGRPEAALDMFERQLLRTPNRPWSQIGLARAHRRLNDTENAVANYRAALENWNQGGGEIPAMTEAREYLANHDSDS